MVMFRTVEVILPHCFVPSFKHLRIQNLKADVLLLLSSGSMDYVILRSTSKLEGEVVPIASNKQHVTGNPNGASAIPWLKELMWKMRAQNRRDQISGIGGQDGEQRGLRYCEGWRRELV